MMTKSIKLTSSDLSDLRNGMRYTWGKIVRIHDITSEGVSYSIVEYEPRPINGKPSKYEREFTAYVGGKEIGGAVNFNGALLLCIANHTVSNKGEANHMATAACKLFDIPRE